MQHNGASLGSEAGAHALDILGNVRNAYSDPEASEVLVLDALRTAPNDFDVRLGAYRFYFYNHKYEAALPHADFIVRHAARRLNIPTDWRDVQDTDAPFGQMDFAPGLYLQALLALGYCQLRMGEYDLGRDAIAKAAELDVSNRFFAKAILERLEEGIEPEDPEENLED